jgi:hypothetical protein
LTVDEPFEPKRPGLSELLPFGQAAEPKFVQKPRRALSPARALAGAITAVLLGLLFRFALPVLFVLAVAGSAVVYAATRWTRGAHVAATIFAAGFLAQMTSIFISPFTWWLRFAFFATLIGSYVLLFVWQTNDL